MNIKTKVRNILTEMCYNDTVHMQIVASKIHSLYQKEMEKKERYLAFDIGCIECGEESIPLGLFDTEAEAKKICDKAKKIQEANWHGQHSFEVFNLSHKKDKEQTSFTCCNIEVNKPVGSEVMCPECKEYCETKGVE